MQSKTTSYLEIPLQTFIGIQGRQEKGRKNMKRKIYFVSDIDKCFFFHFVKSLKNKKHEKENYFVILRGITTYLDELTLKL